MKITEPSQKRIKKREKILFFHPIITRNQFMCFQQAAAAAKPSEWNEQKKRK
jgi:hypothetical protein